MAGNMVVIVSLMCAGDCSRAAVGLCWVFICHTAVCRCSSRWCKHLLKNSQSTQTAVSQCSSRCKYLLKNSQLSQTAVSSIVYRQRWLSKCLNKYIWFCKVSICCFSAHFYLHNVKLLWLPKWFTQLVWCMMTSSMCQTQEEVGRQSRSLMGSVRFVSLLYKF